LAGAVGHGRSILTAQAAGADLDLMTPASVNRPAE
jgi:hypothetical protein